MRMKDLFQNEVLEEVKVNIYADEIWDLEHSVTKEKWLYMMAIYEEVDKAILEDLISERFRKNLKDWESCVEKNNTDIHWTEMRTDKNKQFIAQRWLDWIYKDCAEQRKFYFSMQGINLSNLNLEEFDEAQTLNSIYNRFFRSMVKSSLKIFFKGKDVTIQNVFHESGSQEEHKYFSWHLIKALQNEFKFDCTETTFLPKSHKENERSNIIQLCDVMGGMIKDLHLGYTLSKKMKNRDEIIKSQSVQELIIKRVIENPRNIKSRLGYSNRFNLSFFPRVNSNAQDRIERMKNNYYDEKEVIWSYRNNGRQSSLI